MDKWISKITSEEIRNFLNVNSLENNWLKLQLISKLFLI